MEGDRERIVDHCSSDQESVLGSNVYHTVHGHELLL